MLLCVACSSLVPLIFSIAGNTESPWTTAALSRAGFCIAQTVFLATYDRKLFWQKATWISYRESIFQWTALLFIIAYADYAILAFSLKFVDIAIAALFFEGTVVFAMVLLHIFFRGEDRFIRPNKVVVSLIGLSIIGFGFTALSEYGPTGTFASSSSITALSIGIFLATAAGLTSSFWVAAQRWGVDFGRAVTRETDNLRAELFGIVLARLTGNTISTLITSAVGMVLFGETLHGLNIKTGLALGIAAGIGPIALSKANIDTNTTSVNALTYLIPALSLGFLLCLGLVDVTRVDMLVAGTSIVVAANIGIFLKSK